MGDLVGSLIAARPVLLGRVHAPQSLLLQALPPLLPGSPPTSPYSPGRCCRLITSTISWALRLAGLALAPVKPHTNATAKVIHPTPQPPSH